MQVARLLRASGEVLLLPQKVIAAALIYLHKFRHIARGSDPDDPSQILCDDPYRLVCACLFVAAKANEVVLTSSDLINVVLCLMRRDTWARAAEAIPGLPPDPRQGSGRNGGGSGGRPLPEKALSGDAYYQAKSSLLRDEQVLLRVIRFRVAEELPHVILLNLCRVLQCPPGVVQLAVCILNDSLLLTNLPATSPAELLAAAALQLSSLLSGVPVPCDPASTGSASADDPASGGRLGRNGQWWVGLGVAKEALDEACHRLLDAIEAEQGGASDDAAAAGNSVAPSEAAEAEATEAEAEQRPAAGGDDAGDDDDEKTPVADLSPSEPPMKRPRVVVKWQPPSRQ